MELKTLKSSELLKILGLAQIEVENTPDFESPEFKRYLVNSIRRLYSTQSEGAFARSVKGKILNQFRNLHTNISTSENLKNAIAESHDLLADIGEIVRVEDGDSIERFRSQLSMYVLLSSSVRDKQARALLLGPCWSLENVELPSLLTFDDSTGLRYLKGDETELVNFLNSIGLYSISLDQWRGYPPRFTSEELLKNVMNKLLEARDSREIEDLRIFEKGHQRYFIKRLRALKKSDNGIFIARRVAEFGADISFVVFVQNGVCKKIVSLPIEEIAENEKDCERILIAALDLEIGNPTKITEEKILYKNMMNFVALNFYIPPVSWMLKYLIATGNQLPRPNKGALFTFAVPGESKDGILEQLKKDMFIELS